MRKNQFLLSKNLSKLWEQSMKIGPYYLHCGEGLPYCNTSSKQIEIHLIGDLYDWRNSELKNEDILKDLLQFSELKIFDFIEKINSYFGAFIFIIVKNDKIYLFNDACGQREVYYTTDFIHFGTQVKLLETVSDLIDHTNKDAIDYYQSSNYQKHKLHVHDFTHKKNVKHLLPNHLINISDRKIQRFFPTEPNKQQPIKVIAQKAAVMLKGYLRAIANRKKLLIGLTAGYDSRVLFLASLGLDCTYYINKMSSMDDDHYDISIAKQLCGIYEKELTIIEKDFFKIQFKNGEAKERYEDGIDFPRFSNIATDTEPDEVVINGNISEIARNYFGYFKNLNETELSFLNEKQNLKLAITQYKKWLDNKSTFEKLGFNYLDMFYWEEKMGIWQAKARTELFALDRNFATPYNSRGLLALLLSTNRKDRDAYNNQLYNKIIAELSDQNEKVLNTPINPSKKNTITKLLKRLRLFNLSKKILLKFQMSKFQ